MNPTICLDAVKSDHVDFANCFVEFQYFTLCEFCVLLKEVHGTMEDVEQSGADLVFLLRSSFSEFLFVQTSNRQKSSKPTLHRVSLLLGNMTTQSFQNHARTLHIFPEVLRAQVIGGPQEHIDIQDDV